MGFIKGREVEKINLTQFGILFPSLSCDSTRISVYTQVFLNVGKPSKIRNQFLSICRRNVSLSVFFLARHVHQ